VSWRTGLLRGGRPFRDVSTLFPLVTIYCSPPVGGEGHFAWCLCWFLRDGVEEVEEALGEGRVGEDDVVDRRVRHVCGHS